MRGEVAGVQLGFRFRFTLRDKLLRGFGLLALVAVLVYIVDVKPAVVRVQGGGQRW